MLTDAQKRYVELEKKKDEYKAFIEELKEATTEVINEIGIGGHFQDSEGTVYQTSECDGKFDNT